MQDHESPFTSWTRCHILDVLKQDNSMKVIFTCVNFPKYGSCMLKAQWCWCTPWDLYDQSIRPMRAYVSSWLMEYLLNYTFSTLNGGSNDYFYFVYLYISNIFYMGKNNISKSWFTVGPWQRKKWMTKRWKTHVEKTRRTDYAESMARFRWYIKEPSVRASLQAAGKRFHKKTRFKFKTISVTLRYKNIHRMVW